jgi:2-polyprenyl-6-methoxyphenol hydroxylase-like FAD-dependent oxidoreductase
MSTTAVVQTRCCIVGGGPAGMMVGLLLARGGVKVLVLEKHADFLRDFRGDTVHPSTLELMHELGLLEKLLRRPHQKLGAIGAQLFGERHQLADFSHLRTQARFIVFMPQWELLDFLAEQARTSGNFELRMESEVVGLIQEGGRVAGVRANTPQGPIEVRSDLVIGADGRSSLVRAQAGLAVQALGAPMDVLWMRISRKPSDPEQTLGYIAPGHFLIMLDRGDYWQCAVLIPKGQFEAMRQQPITTLQEQLTASAPFLSDRRHELASWGDVSLLTVKVDRLRHWHRPGLLCIGDAAHAMSPIGGVGINLAVQDAVATANLLAAELRRGAPSLRQLARVQKRRELPTRLTQSAQVRIQNGFVAPTLSGVTRSAPRLARLLDQWPLLRRIPAYLIGIGVRPEHVGPELRVARPAP